MRVLFPSLAVRGGLVFLSLGVLLLATILPTAAQKPVQSSIIGLVRLSGGKLPTQRLEVQLWVRGAVMQSVYADSQGRFGFYGLLANAYELVVEAEGYQAVRQLVVVRPSMVTPANVMLILRPIEIETVEAAPPETRDQVSLVELLLKQAPEEARKEFDLGLDASRSGKTTEAIRHYRKAVEIAPEYYPAHNNMGSLLLQQGDISGAEAAFQRVIEINDEDSPAYFNLGHIQILKGEFAGAQGYIDDGLTRDPESWFGHYLLGVVYLRTGRLFDAEGEINQAIEFRPQDPMPHLALAEVYLKQQREQEALATLKRFQHEFPTHPSAEKARDTILMLEEWLRVNR